MHREPVPSPMNRTELIDEYFIENRTKVLDIAAFLDRLDRTGEHNEDFRTDAMQHALRVLAEGGGSRVLQVQMILSDPTTEPLTKLDRKSARGAFDPRRKDVR
jgi:hypothetical protein